MFHISSLNLSQFMRLETFITRPAQELEKSVQPSTGVRKFQSTTINHTKTGPVE